VSTRPEDSRRSSQRPRKWRLLPRTLTEGRSAASRWSRCPPGTIRSPVCLGWKPRGDLWGLEEVGTLTKARGMLRDRARLGYVRSTIGSSTVPRKRVTRLGQVQTIVALSAGGTKAQGRIRLSDTATWSKAMDSITDQDPEVGQVRNAAPSAMRAAKEQSRANRGRLEQ